MAQARRGLRSIEPIDLVALDAEADDLVARFEESGDALEDLIRVQRHLHRAEDAERRFRQERDLAIASVSRHFSIEHGVKFQDALGLTNAGLQDIRKRLRKQDAPYWADAPRRAREAAIASIRARKEAQLWRPIRNDLLRRVSAERDMSNLRIAERTGLNPGHVSRIVRGQVGDASEAR